MVGNWARNPGRPQGRAFDSSILLQIWSFVGRSSKGRTLVFEASYTGSSPVLPSKRAWPSGKAPGFHPGQRDSTSLALSSFLGGSMLRRVSRLKYNWTEINAYHQEGNSVLACIGKFGFSKGAWDDARKSGRVKPREWKIPLDKLLVEHSTVGRGHIKGRLIREGKLERKCYECGITEWRGRPLSFNLDHINGVNDDYRLDNLRIVCPNCDSQSQTFSGRNAKRNCDVLAIGSQSDSESENPSSNLGVASNL